MNHGKGHGAFMVDHLTKRVLAGSLALCGGNPDQISEIARLNLPQLIAHPKSLSRLLRHHRKDFGNGCSRMLFPEQSHFPEKRQGLIAGQAVRAQTNRNVPLPKLLISERGMAEISVAPGAMDHRDPVLG